MVQTRGVRVECVQTDNGIEFTNRFSTNKKNRLTRFELTAARLGILHNLIRPYTPRHNGKVERSHREDQKRFYDTHRFFSLADFVCSSLHTKSFTTYLCVPWPGSLLKKSLLLPLLLSLYKMLDKPTAIALFANSPKELPLLQTT